LLNHFFDWLQYTWGAASNANGDSYSKLLLGSLNFWDLLEGTHLLTLTFFFGSIMLVDLRLLGISFKQYPVSTVERRLLPITITAMLILMITGAMLFFAKPEFYWHNLMFRTKLVLLAIAIGNVGIFHQLVENNKDEWDAAPSTPSKAKWSAVVSLLSWVLVIASGRFIAYNWFECGKGQPEWVNVTQDCKNSRAGATTPDGHHEGAVQQ
jgi:uncharacterized membrane protein